jgi:hypothetical protein
MATNGIDQLIQTLRTERARIESLLAELTETQLHKPGVLGPWSVKDIIVHLTVWEQRGTGWIRSLAQGEIPQIPLPGYTWDVVDQLNQETYETNRNKPLKEVLAEFQRSFTGLLTQLQSLTEEDLDRSFEPYWTDGEPFTLRELVEWRYLHYRSHRRQIEAWLKGLDERS